MQASAPPPTVAVIPATRQTVPIFREYVGRTQPNQSVDVRPQVSGILKSTLFSEGSPVREGDVLFRIDPAQYQAALLNAQGQSARAEADVAQAKAQLEKARRDVARYEPLARQRAIPQEELENAQSSVQVAQAQVGQAQAALAAARAGVSQAELNLGYTVIRSPLTGIIGRRQVDPGNLVSPQSETPLVTVSSSDPIRVTFDVSDVEYLAFARRTGVRPGRQLRNSPNFDMILSDGSVFPQKGRFLLVERAVTAQTGTLPIVAVFPNPGNFLRPGQFVRVRVTTEQMPNVVLVPQGAVQEVLGARSIYIVSPQNKVVQRTVTIQGAFENRSIVTQGLEQGDRVIVEGAQKVRPGMTVQPQVKQASAS